MRLGIEVDEVAATDVYRPDAESRGTAINSVKINKAF
jgi:hypothetical protein